ncbi:ABC transporter substrate-binding protein [Candidatus Bathyarchaeota archaeon]|nr:MAG: ABC transporter substrate-binding protein [Candidatus Bathyarchaeota archaeon]
MSINKNYIAIIAVVIVVAGGYWWFQSQQTTPADDITPDDPALAVRRAKWESWQETMYIGGVGGEFHPGVQNLGSGRVDELQSYLMAGKLLWNGQAEFLPNMAYFNPLIAESWEAKTNTTTGETYLEFKIKEGLVFQDGTTINAEAVKYCYEQEAFEMPKREQHRWTAPAYWHTHAWSRLEVPDEYTLHIYIPEDGFLPMTFAGLFALNYANIYSPTSTELYAKETDPIESFANQKGFGPFQLVECIAGEREVFEAWDEYPVNPLGPYAGPSRSEDIKYVVVQMYTDEASLRMAVEAGQVDHTAGGISRADVEDMQNNPALVVDYVPWVGAADLLHLNYREEFYPLNDTNVRKAIQYVIDPDEIVDKLMFGTAEVSDSTVRPIQPYFKPVMKQIRDLPMEERLETARALLTEAGFPNGFTSELWYPSGGSEEFSREMGTIIQAQLAQVGIDIEIKMIDSAVYSTFRSEGRLPMFFRGWTLDYMDPDAEINYMMLSTSTYLTIPLGFNDTHVDDLIAQGRALLDPTGDPPERAEVYEELQDYIVENGFTTPLYISGYWDVKQAWVEGYEYWYTCDVPYQGVWAASKVIPEDWATRDPPIPGYTG